MPAVPVWVAGERYLLVKLKRWTMRKRCSTFRRFSERKLIVLASVEHKLENLRYGVRWEYVTGCRFFRKDFLRIKKREMRWVRGQVRSKKSPCKHSFFVRFKCASHLVLRGREAVVDWDTVPDRSLFNCGILSERDLRFLLSGVRRGLSLRARQHLREELQTAAACSWSFFFGKMNWGTK